MAKQWIRAGGSPWTEEGREMSRAAAQMAVTGSSTLCPMCHQEMLRFYYRVRPPRPPLHPNDRSTIWAWCVSCEQYGSVDLDCAPAEGYLDPLRTMSDQEFGTLPRGQRWIEYLNTLWEAGKLQKQFRVRPQEPLWVPRKKSSKRNRGRG